MLSVRFFVPMFSLEMGERVIKLGSLTSIAIKNTRNSEDRKARLSLSNLRLKT